MGKYTVYVHINKTNGKRYVGLTSTPVKRRWDNGSGYMEGTFIRSAINKYGFDGFEHVILAENLSKEDACCLEQEYIAKWNTTNRQYGYNQTLGGEGHLIHGDSGTKLYHVWNSTIGGESGFGKRGVDVYEEWRDYPTFKKWAMSTNYGDGKILMRVDFSKGFCPNNCKWVTKEEWLSHIANGRERQIEYNGETHTLTEWAKITGINKQTLQMRLDNMGWSIERALTTTTEKKPYKKSNMTGLPHHVCRKRNKYEVCVQKKGKKYRKVCATINEAIEERNRLLAQYENL